MTDLTPKERERKLRQALALLETEGCTEAEMQARLEKSQVLLAELKMTVAQARGEAAGADPMISDQDFLTSYSGWIPSLLGQVAKLYFCKYYSEKWPVNRVHPEDQQKARPLLAGWKNRHILIHFFVGKTVDVMTAKAMGEYIISAMEAICTEEKKKWPASERQKFETAFMNACSMRVQYNIYLRIKETKVATVSNGETLPALNTLYEQAQRDAENFLKMNNVNLQTRNKVTTLHHAGGARAGREAGDRIGLDQQVGGVNGRLRLK